MTRRDMFKEIMMEELTLPYCWRVCVKGVYRNYDFMYVLPIEGSFYYYAKSILNMGLPSVYSVKLIYDDNKQYQWHFCYKQTKSYGKYKEIEKLYSKLGGKSYCLNTELLHGALQE